MPPKGMGYPKGGEYKPGKSVHRQEKAPKHQGPSTGSWGSPSSRGVPRSHNDPGPPSSMHPLPTHKMGSGPKKMQGAKMNPVDQNAMPQKKTQGVR